ncbi:MAG: transporter substrate-binding protein [Symbiobacteriaceae bacterium]|jgi:ABC-type glycerol-3-phosphate transport system substrate-binding protein|nr:transporter substrate-binding protein [Symbiobacteriaceae bacterium]
MRRHRTLAAVILALSLLVTACGGSKSTPTPTTPSTTEPSAQKPVEKTPATVTVWSWRTQDEALWKKLQEKMDANNEKITIEFRGIKSTEFDSVLKTAMSGGDGPDLFTARGGAGTKTYAEAKQIVPLDSLDLKGFDKGILEQASFEGKVYAVPFAVQTETFFYNKKIFDANGLKEPQTWDELMKTMETLKSKGITPLAVGGKDGYALCLMVDTIGATFLGDQWASDAIAGKTNYADAKFVDVLTKINNLQKYAQKDFIGTAQRDARTLFATGQTAMIIDGIWAVNTYYLKTDPNIQLGSFLAPPAKAGDPVRLYPYVDGGYAVNAASKVKEAAMRVAGYTATDEFAQLYADLFAEIPGNKNVKFDAAKQPMLAKAVEQKNAVGLKTLFRIRSPFDSGTPDISTSLGANLQGMLSNKQTPEQTAQALQKDLASWYPAFKK